MIQIEGLTVLEREELLINHALKEACKELEILIGTSADTWEIEMINRARNWLQAELDQRFIDELGEEVEEEAIV